MNILEFPLEILAAIVGQLDDYSLASFRRVSKLARLICNHDIFRPSGLQWPPNGRLEATIRALIRAKGRPFVYRIKLGQYVQNEPTCIYLIDSIGILINLIDSSISHDMPHLAYVLIKGSIKVLMACKDYILYNLVFSLTKANMVHIITRFGIIRNQFIESAIDSANKAALTPPGAPIERLMGLMIKPYPTFGAFIDSIGNELANDTIPKMKYIIHYTISNARHNAVFLARLLAIYSKGIDIDNFIISLCHTGASSPPEGLLQFLKALLANTWCKVDGQYIISTLCGKIITSRDKKIINGLIKILNVAKCPSCGWTGH
jgi:F-box domain